MPGHYKRYLAGKLRRGGRLLFGPAVLKRMDVAGAASPRLRTQVPGEQQPVVYAAENITRPQDAFRRAGDAWAGAFSELFPPGVKVLVKINLNSSCPYPGSTSPETAAALADFLHEKGITDITFGDCSGNHSLPTLRTARRNGVIKAIEGKARFVCFDGGPWTEVPLRGSMLGKVTVPRSALEAERIINLANLKTHCLADFSFGLKLAVGFMHPLERRALHRDNLCEKIAEINLAVPADFTIIDGRTAFIKGGPDRGEAAPGNVMIFGANPLAADVHAYGVLYAMKQSRGCLEGFREDPFSMGQLRRAREIGVGGSAWEGYSARKI